MLEVLEVLCPAVRWLEVFYRLEVFEVLEVRCVLLTFETVVMYGHFDGSRAA